MKRSGPLSRSSELSRSPWDVDGDPGRRRRSDLAGQGDPEKVAALISFPCARCERELTAVPIPGFYACPCGAEYELRAMDCEGVEGLAILLLREEGAAEQTASCLTCRTGIGVGHIPPVALFIHDDLALSVVDQVGQLCPVCGAEVPVEVDANAAPRWQKLRGGVHV